MKKKKKDIQRVSSNISTFEISFQNRAIIKLNCFQIIHGLTCIKLNSSLINLNI